MHQAIEAKEGVEIKQENQTLATITLQNFFPPLRLAGMTGTAMTEASEFNKIYNLGVVPIPTNKDMIRADQADLVYRTEEAKFAAVVEDLVERREGPAGPRRHHQRRQVRAPVPTAQPKRGVPHEVLNAKHHEREAAIIAPEPAAEAVTVATNMAGRGTDIMLGGNPSRWPWPSSSSAASIRWTGRRGVRGRLGPHAGATAEPGEGRARGRHRARRPLRAGNRAPRVAPDRQPAPRPVRPAGRPESRFYLSLQDDLMRLFKGEWVDMILRQPEHPDDQPIEHKRVSNAIKSAQTQREAQNFEIRKDVLKYDDVLNRQRQVIYDERRMVLEGEDLSERIRHMLDDSVAAYVQGRRRRATPRCGTSTGCGLRCARCTPSRSPSRRSRTKWATGMA